MTEILKIDNLSKSFDGLELFNEVNLTLQKGTINSLFGKNGTGKTTFFNILTGFLKADKGSIYFQNQKINQKQPFQIVQLGMGKVWQQPRVFGNLTVLENLIVSDKNHLGDNFLNYLRRPLSIKRIENEIRERALIVLEQLQLSDIAEQQAGSLSLGEKKLVNLGMLMMNDAELLILDEPFSAINPATIERISGILKALKAGGKTIFMIEHKWQFAKAISDTIFEIETEK